MPLDPIILYESDTLELCNFLTPGKLKSSLERLTEDTDFEEVKALTIRGSQIGAEEGTALASVIETNAALTTVTLDYNKINDEGVAALSSALEKKIALTTLMIRGNTISKEGTLTLARVFKKNTTLTQLTININPTELKAILALTKVLAKVLEKNSTLTRFCFASTQIGDVEAKVLAEALKKNKTLTTFVVTHNRLKTDQKIGTEGAKAFAEALKENKTLTELNLGIMNRIENAGAAALAEALETNKTLIELKIDKSVSDIYRGNILNLTARNQCLLLDKDPEGLTATFSYSQYQLLSKNKPRLFKYLDDSPKEFSSTIEGIRENLNYFDYFYKGGNFLYRRRICKELHTVETSSDVTIVTLPRELIKYILAIYWGITNLPKPSDAKFQCYRNHSPSEPNHENKQVSANALSREEKGASFQWTENIQGSRSASSKEEKDLSRSK